ncbi:MAG: hypothetical protein KA352_13385 [Flavobacteriales bacterium]|nr:hypothetical protein [Flavobacteriales bacterium]
MKFHFSRGAWLAALVLWACSAFTPVRAQYNVLSEFGNLVDCDTMSRGIFCVWWDNDWNVAPVADELLDTLNVFRDVCLNDLGMQDPPNPPAGHFYNVYLHQGGADVFPSFFGNGQGTDVYGFPYLAIGANANADWGNVAHETFHIFQYSATSPGFAYSGDSQWYIEASANWFAGQRYPDEDRAFVEAMSLVRLSHVPLWLSYDNMPQDYPQNWQRFVHQYAMALWLYYMTEEDGIPATFITQGLYAGTAELPQEYFFNQIGASLFRTSFLNWAAHMTNQFDFLTPDQYTTNQNEWNSYADPLDNNEYLQTYMNTGSGGWYRPADSLITCAWSFNTYRVHNSMPQTYSFQLAADAFGSQGGASEFMGMVVVQNSVSGTSFLPLNMQDAQTGSLILNLMPEDTTAYFIIASVPEVFTGVDQRFGYDMRIETISTGIHAVEAARNLIESSRCDLLGRAAQRNGTGPQIIRYTDGSVRKVQVVR